MDYLVAVLLVLVLAAIGALAVAVLRRRGGEGGDAAVEAELRSRIDQMGRDAEALGEHLSAERAKRVEAETRLEAEREKLASQQALLAEAEAKLKDAFRALSAEALKESRTEFLAAAEDRLKPLRDLLRDYQGRLSEIEKARSDAYGGLRQYLDGLREAQTQLRTQTTRLETALRGSTRTRGRWGEVTLRNVIEAAGMAAFCDYTEQTSTTTEDGRIRPDVTVRLPNDRVIVIDAKAPLDAYMEAVEAEDEAARRAALGRHAGALRNHVRALCQKAYWAQFENTPDFVVLFIPGESFFIAALEADRDLMEDAFRSNVILASPATLMALLKAVAAGWREEALAENARRIADVGQELYKRVCTFAEHLGGVGDGLRRAGKAYNAAVGSYDARLVPGARQLADLGAGTGRDLPDVTPADEPLRALPAGAPDDAAPDEGDAEDHDEARDAAPTTEATDQGEPGE